MVFFCRKADIQLLGKLNDDRLYLEELLNNPVLNKNFNMAGDNPGSNVTRQKVWNCIFPDKILDFLPLFQILKEAKEGLTFLENRKNFWQQQEPVFARNLKIKGQ